MVRTRNLRLRHVFRQGERRRSLAPGEAEFADYAIVISRGLLMRHGRCQRVDLLSYLSRQFGYFDALLMHQREEFARED